MENVILVIHLLLALAMILLILIQRTAQDGGGLTGGGNMGGMFTAKGSANMLTRTTAILAASFIVTSLILTAIASRHGPSQRALNLETLTGRVPVAAPVVPGTIPPAAAPGAPDAAPAAPVPLTAKDVQPTVPAAPAVPMAK